MSRNDTSSRTAYAWQHRAELPGQSSKLDRTPEVAPRFVEAPAKAEGRGSAMVKSERPHPAPRPSPLLALGPDRAAFNARWTREAEAANQDPEDPDRAARREAFKALRRSPQPLSRVRRLNRNVAR